MFHNVFPLNPTCFHASAGLGGGRVGKAPPREPASSEEGESRGLAPILLLAEPFGGGEGEQQNKLQERSCGGHPAAL